MSNKEPLFKGLDKMSLDTAQDLQNRADRIMNDESIDAEKKAKRLYTIVKRQTKDRIEMVESEERVFHLVKDLLNYKKLAQRGLAFMASGHEVNSMFNTIRYIIQNKPEFDNLQGYFQRIRDIFHSNMRMVQEHSYNSYSGATLLKDLNIQFGSVSSKKIIYDESFESMEGSFYLRQAEMLTVISNLMTNALYFSEKIIEVKFVDKKIIVSDDGKGVPEPHKLFTVGYSKKAFSNGNGLGLVLCREMCREVGLDLYLDNSNQYTDLKGASFILNLNKD